MVPMPGGRVEIKALLVESYYWDYALYPLNKNNPRQSLEDHHENIPCLILQHNWDMVKITLQRGAFSHAHSMHTNDLALPDLLQ